MLLKIALLLSMLFQLGAAIIAITLIRRTRYNVSWILISIGFVLMAVRRLFDFSTLFWESQLFTKEDINNWLGILTSLLVFVGVIFIRQIFNLQERVDQVRKESETRVLSAVIQTEEKDRRLFARELHDGLGPVLSSMKMTMSAIDLEKLDPANRKFIERSYLTMDEAIISLKEISNHLSPHLLKNFGLLNAVETFARHLLANTSALFRLSSNLGDKRLSYDLEIGLYRIICELINNSIKHADPRHVYLEIQEESQLIQLKYSDDGCGFEPEKYLQYHNPQGMGLENIRSRIKAVNGEFFIDSTPGNGFSAYIRIPISVK